jgi:hypothetical protein
MAAIRQPPSGLLAGHILGASKTQVERQWQARSVSLLVNLDKEIAAIKTKTKSTMCLSGKQPLRNLQTSQSVVIQMIIKTTAWKAPII